MEDTMPLSLRPRAIMRLFTTALLTVLLAACGGGGSTPAATLAPRATEAPDATEAPKPTEKPEPTAEPTGSIKVTNVVFAKKLSENMEPEEIAEDNRYTPNEPIAISIEIDGRPKEGVIEANFYWQEQQLDSAKVDLSDANGDVIFSIGQSTFVGFTLTPTSLWPISKDFRVEVSIDGEPLDTYTYEVVAEKGSVKTEVLEVVLAQGADEQYSPIDPTTEFSPDQEVFLVGNGNFAKGTWMRGEWYVDGKLDEAGTRLLGPLTEDLEATGFAFSFRPDGGWSEGEHEIALTVNDKELGRYTFIITSTPTVSDPVPAVGGVTIGDLESYDFSTGLFTIEVPANWEVIDNSDSSSVSVAWTAPEGNAAIFVSLLTSADELSAEDLTTFGNDYVTGVFGEDPGFELSDVEEQSDGSMLVPFTVAPEINGETIELYGLTYVEQRGDKLSILTVVFPNEQQQELWDAAFEQIVNSYRIDDSVPIE
jgi:hypothetical protein